MKERVGEGLIKNKGACSRRSRAASTDWILGVKNWQLLRQLLWKCLCCDKLLPKSDLKLREKSAVKCNNTWVFTITQRHTDEQTDGQRDRQYCSVKKQLCFAQFKGNKNGGSENTVTFKLQNLECGVYFPPRFLCCHPYTEFSLDVSEPGKLNDLLKVQNEIETQIVCTDEASFPNGRTRILFLLKPIFVASQEFKASTGSRIVLRSKLHQQIIITNTDVVC